MKNKEIKRLFSVLIIPLQLLMGSIIVKTPMITDNSMLWGILMFCMSFIGFIAIIILNREVLANDWEKYKDRLWLKFVYALIGVLILHGILYIVRLPLRKLSAGPVLDLFALPLYISIPLSIMPLFAPFVEEIVFRHHLFYNFESKTVKRIMFLVSSILFGLVHYNSFPNIIQLIPYMVMGAIFCGIYEYSKNIWASISVHFLFNLLPTVMAVIGTIAMSFM